MKGGINKILRNIVASSTDTEFEKVSEILEVKAYSPILETCKSHFSHGQQRAKREARHL